MNMTGRGAGFAAQQFVRTVRNPGDGFCTRVRLPAVINQTNAIPAEAKSSKKYWIIAVVAGAGAAGAFAATHGSKSSTPSTLQPGIVAGSPTFGPPNP